MAAMMMATTMRAPRMYLLEANQDSDCAALRNNVGESEKDASEEESGDDASEGCGATAASRAAGSIGGWFKS